jgi:hypothetical protein
MFLTPEQKKQLIKELDSFARLDTTETRRQRLIRACVSYWEKLYPRRVENWDEDIKKHRESLRDTFAQSQGAENIEMRHMFSLPGNRNDNGIQTMGLFDLIEEIFKIFEENNTMAEELRPFSEKEERDWFWFNFPRYRIASKI